MDLRVLSDETAPPVALKEGLEEEASPGATSGALTVLLSGLGLLTDTYDLQVFNLARGFIALEHPMSDADEAAITASAIAGALVGMLGFGLLADALGRRGVFIATALLTTLGALGSACVSGEAAVVRALGGMGIYAQLALCRFVMGVGIGGEYPLSAANTAEHATARGGRQLAITFSMMGWGGLLAPAAFAAMRAAGVTPAHTWRLGFALGAAL